MLIPLKDINPTQRAPIITWVLVAANLLTYIFQLAVGLRVSIYSWGLIPARLLNGEGQSILVRDYGATAVGAEPLTTLLSSMFMHGGFLHLAGNMLYLWIFGNNVEDRLGHLRFLAFYLVGGIVASLSHALLYSSSHTPMIGASGAVAAVLGAYYLLYPRARVRCLLFLFVFVTFIELPAAWVLGWWILIQFLNFFLGAGIGSGGVGGVAWVAHIAGFLAGMGLLYLLGFRRQPRSHS